MNVFSTKFRSRTLLGQHHPAGRERLRARADRRPARAKLELSEDGSDAYHVPEAKGADDDPDHH
eukprot:3304748-Prymnesium_polylepis.1